MKRGRYFVFLAIFFWFCIVDAQYYITTVVGNGVAVSNGDGSQATSAAINNPTCLWTDTIGNLYIVELNKVRKVATNGIITTIAGTGNSDSSGIGGSAVSVNLDGVFGVYGDTSGNLYIGGWSFFLWKLDLFRGNISRIAGATPGISGYGGDGGQATSATMQYPRHIFLSTSGRLYFTDKLNHRIRVVDLSTGIITTIAGNGSPAFLGDGGDATSSSLYNPHGVWGNTAGVIFFADSGNKRVRQISTSGIISTFAGGTTNYQNNVSPTSTSLNGPFDIKGDSLGNIYILVGDECRVRMVLVSANIITTIAGTGLCLTTSTTSVQLATSFNLNIGYGLWVDSVGNILYSDYTAKYIQKITSVMPTHPPSPTPSSQSTSQPTLQPSSQPSCQPTMQPTSRPSSPPTSRPTTFPTSHPSFLPTSQLSSQPSTRPSYLPTTKPTTQPSLQPSSHPSSQPTVQPTDRPSSAPSRSPTNQPTAQPITAPSSQPSAVPSLQPSPSPTSDPSSTPSCYPSSFPSSHPSSQSTMKPSTLPSSPPTSRPTIFPSNQPSTQRSIMPTTLPTTQPSSLPSSMPSRHPMSPPSSRPSSQPVSLPTSEPSSTPTKNPSSKPTMQPFSQPTSVPTNTQSVSSSSGLSSSPSSLPAMQTTSKPSSGPSTLPIVKPTNHPTSPPSSLPSNVPNSEPSAQPTFRKTIFPSPDPSSQPSSQPSIQACQPTCQPTDQPGSQLTHQPSMQPSSQPSSRPTDQPVPLPTSQPSCQPTSAPSSKYTRSPTILKPSTSPTAFLTTITLNSSTWKEVLSLIGVFSSSPSTSSSFRSTLIPLDPSQVSDGSSHIIFGGKNLFEGGSLLSLSSTNPYSAVAKIAPGYRRDTVSRSAIMMGDVNGDGCNDALICNPLMGSCYLLFGNANSGLRNVAVSVTIVTSSTSFSSDYFGFAMTSLGDMNGDGRDDMMVSALTGRVCYVIYGRLTSAWLTSLQWKVNDLVASSSLSRGGYRIKGDVSSISVVGISLTGLDDMNGDDVSDMAMSAMLLSRYVVFVIYGSVSVVSDILLSEIMVGSRGRGFMVYGEVGYYTGFSISSGGDMNGDGITELVVGAYSFPASSSGKSSQVAYIIAGKMNRTSNVDLGSDTISSYGVKVGGGGGFIVSSISDVNKDGYDDVMVTSCVDFVGKSNAYIVNYPSDMTSAPSFLPSSTPSMQPSSHPTSRPSTSFPTYQNVPTMTEDPTSFTTPQPTNINSTQTPVVAPTRQPTRTPTLRASSPPRTSNPSRFPTLRPSTSFMPTRHPTLAITRTRTTSSPRPNHLPTTHPTSTHSPSPLPTTTTKNNGAYSVQVVNSSSPRIVYGQEGANEYFHIFSLSANGVERGGVSVTIYGRGGKKVYLFTPKDPMLPRNKIVIGDFDEREDKLDLSLISGIHGMKDLAYVTHPLTFRTPDEQLIVLSSHLRHNLEEENFVFSSDSSSSSDSPSYIIDMISSASFLIPMVLIIVGCGLMALGVTFIQKEDKDEINKIIEDESFVVKERVASGESIEAHNIPLEDSGLMIDDKKNTDIQENDFRSLSLNISDDGEDRGKVEEEFGSNNVVKEGGETLSGGSVSISSADLEEMFSVPSSPRSYRSEINSDEEESSSDDDVHSLIKRGERLFY